MIIRFSKTLVNKFNLNNFSILVGSVGLYFIFLKDLQIPYPFKNSHLIYIGMSESRNNSIGNRLRDHLSGRSGNTGIIGYRRKWELYFTYLEDGFLKQIFPNETMESIETYFLEKFANEFGVYPICNNRRGSVKSIPLIHSIVKIDWDAFGE